MHRAATTLIASFAVLVAAASVGAAAEGDVPFGPPAPASAASVEALRQELAKLRADSEAARAEDARARAALEKQLSAEHSAREHDAAEARARSERAESAATVRAGKFGLTLSGFAHVDVQAWKQLSSDEISPSGDPLNENRFLLRRVRLRAALDWRYLFGVIELDANTVKGVQVRPIGVEVGARWPASDGGRAPLIAATLGLFKTPFGFEVMQQSDKERLFLERAAVLRAMFPGEYDLGVKVGGQWRFLRYTLAAMNGDPIGERAFPGRDPNRSKDFVGRVGVDTRLGKRVNLRGGFSGVYGQGFTPGTTATKDQLVWRDTDENGAVALSEIQVIPGQAAVPSKNFDRWAVGGDLGVAISLPVVGDLTLYGELVFGSNLDRGLTFANPVSAGRDLRELGFYLGFTLELTRWGMFGIRYDYYDPDKDRNQLAGGVQVPLDLSMSTLEVAAALRLWGYARLIAGYDHNTNALGRGANGAPATLGDDAFILRGEVVF